MFSGKYGMGSVVAIALFLVVTVLAAITFQSWMTNFQSTQFVDIETQSDSIININILDLVAGKLYVDSNSNVSVSQVEINKRDCDLMPSLSSGVNTVDVSSCLSGMSDNKYDVVLVTGDGVYSEEFFSESGFEDIIFAKLFSNSGGNDDSFSLIRTTEGGFGLFGYRDNGVDEDIWLIKTDSSGNELWNVSFDGGNGDDRGESLIETSDGGFCLFGYVNNGINKDFWLIKTDSSGNELWNVSFDNGDDNYVGSIVETNNGGLVLLGITEDAGSNQDFWLVKTDSNGNELWNVSFDKTSADYAHGLVETNDGGLVLFGDVLNPGFDGDFWMIKTNSSGSELWNVSFDSSATDFGDIGAEIIETSDGGLVLSGFSLDGSFNSDGWLIKTNSSGGVLWNSTVGVTGAGSDEVPFSLIETSDGGFSLIGYVTNSSFDDSFWVSKTNSTGGEIWTQTFYSGSGASGSFLVETSDGGFGLLGSLDNGVDTDFWFIKTNSTGGTCDYSGGGEC